MDQLQSVLQTAQSMSLASEGDVETQIVIPLLLALGWQRSEIHTKVPVKQLRGRNRGRLPEADFVVAAADPRPPTIGYMVVEAKKPGESVKAAVNQAYSYTSGLKAPLFFIVNDKEIAIYLNPWYGAVRELWSGELVPGNALAIEQHIGRKFVVERIQEYAEREAPAPGYCFDKYFKRMRALAIKYDGIDRAVYLSQDENLSVSAMPDLAAQFIFIHGRAGTGKTTGLWMALAQTLERDSSSLPVFVDCIYYGRGSLEEAIVSVVNDLEPTFHSTDDFELWLRGPEQALSLAIDNFDRLSVELRLDWLRSLQRLGAMSPVSQFFVASRFSIPIGEVLENVSIVRVGRLSTEEVNASVTT